MSDVRVQDDLYEYVNGEWIKNAVIPDDRPVTGGFMDLDEDVEKKMMRDLADFSNGKQCDIDCVKDAIKLYGLVKDVDRRNDLGIKPVMGLLNKIKGMNDVSDLNELSYELMLDNVDLPVNFGVEADMEDARKNAFVVLGPSIILPDTEYYGSDKGNELLDVYKDMAYKVLKYSDLSDEEIKEYVDDTLKYDELISKRVKSQLEWADYVKNHNPMDLDLVCEDVKPFDLKGLLKKIYGDNIPCVVDVYDPRAIKEMREYFNNDNFNLYKHWLYVRTLLGACSSLSVELCGISNTFRRILTGVVSDPTIDRQAYKVTSSVYSQPLGMYYGKTYFGEEAKKDIVSLVKKIIEAYKVRIKNNTFLEDNTKQKAIRKLNTITIKMGYPDSVPSIYNEMHIDENKSYFENMQMIHRVKILDNLNKLHKPVDKNEWMMPGHMVNACYDPSRNDITFPAAILQKPFYSLNQSMAENLGGIGAVIAHEISHAFDNNGAHFDENGNLFDWWSQGDLERFNELTKKMIEQWDGIEYCGDRVNGELVVSENIADNGGIGVTIQIMHELGNDDFKSYFMNFARIWCQKSKDEYKLFLLKNDVHSPAKLRTNVQVLNFKEFYEAFDVKESDRMYLSEDKRIIIW